MAKPIIRPATPAPARREVIALPKFRILRAISRPREMMANWIKEVLNLRRLFFLINLAIALLIYCLRILARSMKTARAIKAAMILGV